MSGNWTFKSPTCTAGGASRSVAVFAVVLVATLAALGGAVDSVGGGLAAVGTAAGVITERRFEEVLPKLLMRLKKRLVRLPPCSSVEMIDAAPDCTSLLAGTGPGVDAFDRPNDLRRKECNER